MFGFFHRNATSGIAIGTVTTGNTASAEITPDGKLNLVLPAMSQQAEERLTAVETQLASVAQTAQGAADDAAALTTEIQDVRSDYAADIEAARSALQGSINTVNATVSQHTTSISNAQRTAEAAQASASSLRGDVTTLQDDVQTAQSTANSAQSTANAAQTAAEEAALAALKTSLELVWENPDQNQPMGATTESPVYIGGANDDAYEAIMVDVLLRKCVPGTLRDDIVASPFVLKGHKYLLRVPNVTTINDKKYAGFSSRGITFNEDGKHFSVSAGAIVLAGTNDDGVNNDELIPVRVYGIRQINSNLPTT